MLTFLKFVVFWNFAQWGPSSSPSETSTYSFNYSWRQFELSLSWGQQSLKVLHESPFKALPTRSIGYFHRATGRYGPMPCRLWYGLHPLCLQFTKTSCSIVFLSPCRLICSVVCKTRCRYRKKVFLGFNLTAHALCGRQSHQ